MREGRARGQDLFGNSESNRQEDALLNSSSLPLAQYEEKPIGARNENSVLFFPGYLEGREVRTGERAPAGGDRHVAHGGGHSRNDGERRAPGMDPSAMLLSAPVVEAPVPAALPPPQPHVGRSRIDTTPPTSRGSGKIILLVAVVLGALAVMGGVVFVMRSRLSPEPAASSVAEANASAVDPSVKANATPSATAAPAETVAATAAPVAPQAAAPVAAAPPTPAAPAEPAAKAATETAPVALAVASKPATAGAQTREAKIDALKAAMRPDKPGKSDDKPGKDDSTPAKVVLAEDSPGGGDAPAAPADEPPKPPFDTSAAKSALETASAGAASCKKPDGPTGRGKVQVTFSPTGRATSANVIEGPFGGTPTGGCVAKVFRAAHVPAFSGDPVTVSKSFTIPE